MDDELECKVREDREIRFDVHNLHKTLRNGEQVLYIMHNVEDTKGNPGDTGKLVVSNLRVMWHSLNHKKYNLSVGFSKIITMNVKTVITKTRGTAQALYILASGVTTRFEFLFTEISGDKRERPVFSEVFDIYKSYQSSYLYREMKLRGSIVQNGQLILLPDERVYTNMHGVWNLSSDQGNLGSFIITNIRMVWFADLNESFNLSLPYIQIGSIKIRDSKYGPALVIQTTETAGGYVLGFRIDPIEKLTEIFKELTSLHSVYSAEPNFGVKYEPQDGGYENLESKKTWSSSVSDFDEVYEVQDKEINSKFNMYALTSFGAAAAVQRPPVYCKELGFAIEQIRDGYTLSDLWNVVPNKNE